MIYVTVGTLFLDFPRLINEVDRIAASYDELVIVQKGLGTTSPSHCQYFDFKPREEILRLQQQARVIVAHAGIGSVLDALNVRRPLIVVPRLKKYGEHLTDHQIDLARGIERRGWGRVIWEIEELEEACLNPPPPPLDYCSSRHRLVSAVEEFVERVAARKALGKRGFFSRNIYKHCP